MCYVCPINQTQNMSLGQFAKAKPTTKSTNDEKKNFRVPANVAAAINGYVQASLDLDAAEAKKAQHEAVVKSHGFDLAAEMLGKGEEFESFILSSQENGLLYILQDKFGKLDAKKAAAARALLGEDSVTETTTYTFNDEVLQRHGDKIAAMIETLDIPAEDKEILLESTTSWKFSFGLNQIGSVAKEKSLTASKVMEIVKPTQQLKVRGKK